MGLHSNSEAFNKRDYSLTGPEGKLAQEKGLLSAEWYTSPISGKRLKELMKRKDGPAIRDTFVWFGLLVISGIIAYHSWGTWWAIPAFLIYGVLYCTPCDSRYHECGHGTAFKTPWMNAAIFQLVGFMTLKNTRLSRWSHVHHHSDTIVVGLDPEIPVRPPVWRALILEIVKVYGGLIGLKNTILHCFGRMDKQAKVYIPVSQHRIVYWESRISVLILLGIIAWSVLINSILPVMFIILPVFYGSFLSVLITMTQHIGLCEDVLDHRLNTRTIYMNPIFRFLYWNMNYHIEHHMFPMIPYHALPDLHNEMKHDCPEPSPSLWAALNEVYLALVIQRKNPSFYLVRPLPKTARQYRYGPSAMGEEYNVHDLHNGN